MASKAAAATRPMGRARILRGPMDPFHTADPVGSGRSARARPVGRTGATGRLVPAVRATARAAPGPVARGRAALVRQALVRVGSADRARIPRVRAVSGQGDPGPISTPAPTRAAPRAPQGASGSPRTRARRSRRDRVAVSGLGRDSEAPGPDLGHARDSLRSARPVTRAASARGSAPTSTATRRVRAENSVPPHVLTLVPAASPDHAGAAIRVPGAVSASAADVRTTRRALPKFAMWTPWTTLLRSSRVISRTPALLPALPPRPNSRRRRLATRPSSGRRGRWAGRRCDPIFVRAPAATRSAGRTARAARPHRGPERPAAPPRPN